MRIAVNEAQIHTATVEIRTLTVSGKQVTLAVFRQLEEEFIEDVSGELRGIPWGRVNYHADQRCKSLQPEDHLHVVWQLGSELRSALVIQPGCYDERTRAVQRMQQRFQDRPHLLYHLELREKGNWKLLRNLPHLFIAV